MDKIKIYFNYKHTEEPWGGGNNFIKALYNVLSTKKKFKIIENMSNGYNIHFFNQLGLGPENHNRLVTMKDIKKIKYHENAAIHKYIVTRAVNLLGYAHSTLNIKAKIHYYLYDCNVIKLLNLSDFIIYQSEYLKNIFIKKGVKNKNYKVIYNGADQRIFNLYNKEYWNGRGKLKIVSSTAATRKTKRHDIIAKISEYSDVVVNHIGQWPENIDEKNVNLLGMMSQQEMARIFKRSHVLLHPAVKDPCPNVLFEGISCGLPVIYNNDIGSSREIVKDNGLGLEKKDLLSTINKMKDNYKLYIHNIKEKYDFYGINRAVKEYAEVFYNVVKY